MAQGLACPICNHVIRTDLEVGNKVTCSACESVHRVRGAGGDLHLQVLIESLSVSEVHPAEAEASAGESKAESVGPKLTTWKDRVRSETRSSTRASGRTGRKSTLSGRRRQS